MQLAAISHRTGGASCYPVGPDRLRVVVTAARGDLARVVCFHSDRYVWPTGKEAMVELAREASSDLHDYWVATLPAPSRRVRYRFFLQDQAGDGSWFTEDGFSRQRPGSSFFNYSYMHHGDAWRLPEWSRRSIFYQIFVDRFCNGDPTRDPAEKMPWGEKPTGQSVAGGDLAGVQQKLPYLQALGVNCIYFTPIFQSPSNHKYDTQDYYQIDPSFGSNETFGELVRAAHGQGIRVLLDAVFNHSGDRWFAFADVLKNGAASPYWGWFYQLPASGAVVQGPPNYETFAADVATMPKLDTSNPECREYLLQVASYWLRTAGIDGWRLDVANEVDHGFWRDFRRTVRRENPEAFILGEVWFDSSDWLQGDQFDSVMNYPWREAVLRFLQGKASASEFDAALVRLRYRYPWPVLAGQLNLLGSHDVPRVRTELGGSAELAGLGAVLLLTAPGVPLVYYADEVGLEGGGDPDCRRCYPWDTPELQHAGLFGLYRQLIALRHELPWLNDGAWQTVLADDATDVFAYTRCAAGSDLGGDADEQVTVVLNPRVAPVTVYLPLAEGRVDLLAGSFIGSARLVAGADGGCVVGRPAADALCLTLPGAGAALLVPAELAHRLLA